MREAGAEGSNKASSYIRALELLGPILAGSVILGLQASIVIAAASPHRAGAFQACRYVIERVKQIAPIWKRETFEGGEDWIEGATADPSDTAARQAAYERACG